MAPIPPYREGVTARRGSCELLQELYKIVVERRPAAHAAAADKRSPTDENPDGRRKN
jgi:hypothetical protein